MATQKFVKQAIRNGLRKHKIEILVPMYYALQPEVYVDGLLKGFCTRATAKSLLGLRITRIDEKHLVI